MLAGGLYTLSLLLAAVSAQPQWQHERGWRQHGREHRSDWSYSGQATSVSSNLTDAETAASTSLTASPCVNTVSVTAHESATVTVDAASSTVAAVTPATRKHKTRKHTKQSSERTRESKHTSSTPHSTTKILPTGTPPSTKTRRTKKTSTAPTQSPETSSKVEHSSSDTVAASPSPIDGSATPSTPSAAAIPTSAVVETAPSATEISPTSLQASPTSDGSSKRGLITFDELIPAFADNEKITWNMNWWHGPPDGKPADWLFLPQLIRLEPDEWWADAAFRKDPGAFPYIAGFLEPGVNGITVEDAVESWKTNLEPLAANHKLIPPIVGQNDLSWLQEFMSACTGCTFEGPVAFTLYVSPDDNGIADFKNHVEEFTAAFPNKDVWAANIGILGEHDLSKSEWLMKQVVPLLDDNDRISHYAWNGDLGGGATTLWDGNGLTSLGELYATL